MYLGVILHLLVFHQSVCVQFPSFPSAEKQRLSEGCQCAVIRYQRERGQWAGWQVAHPPDVRDQYPTTRIPNSSSSSSSVTKTACAMDLGFPGISPFWTGGEPTGANSNSSVASVKQNRHHHHQMKFWLRGSHGRRA